MDQESGIEERFFLRYFFVAHGELSGKVAIAGIRGMTL